MAHCLVWMLQCVSRSAHEGMVMLRYYASFIALIGTLTSGCSDEIAATKAAGAPCISGAECSSGACVAVCLESVEEALPVSDAGSNRLTLGGLEVTLDGSSSSDPQGRELGYSWTLLSTPAGSTAQLVDADTPTPKLTPDRPGLYALSLVVATTSGGTQFTSQPDDVGVFVFKPDGTFPKAEEGNGCTVDFECASGRCVDKACVPNRAPQANAGIPQNVDIGTLVTLSGENSTDPDGDSLSYDWQVTQTPANSQITLSATVGMETTLTPDVAGVFVVTLYTNDGMLSSSPSNIVIVADPAFAEGRPDGAGCDLSSDCQSQTCDVGTCVQNLPPTADAGAIQYVNVGTPVMLDGASSLDPEDAPLSYQWGLFESPAGSSNGLENAAAVQSSFTPDVPGVYLVRLIVSDGIWPSSPAIVTIVAGVGAPGLPPGTTPDGDNCGAPGDCASKTCLAGTCAANQVPTADAGENQLVPSTTVVNLDGGSSSDPEGVALTYLWTLVDKPLTSVAALTGANTAAPNFTADVVGFYRIALTVDDGSLLSEPSVMVVAAGVGSELAPAGFPCTAHWACESALCLAGTCVFNGKPTADAGAPQLVLAGDVVTLDGTASTDPEGQELDHAWSLEGPNGSVAALSMPASAQPTFQADIAGVYTLTLNVSDGFRTDTVVTVVVAAPIVGVLNTGQPCGADEECQSGWCSGACQSNVAPTAVVAPAEGGRVGDVITLNGSVSTDPENATLGFSWTLAARPAGSAATLVSTDAATTSFSADLPGIYAVALRVDDGYLTSAPAIENVIIVTNAGPTAAIAVSLPTQPQTGAVIGLDGTASSDPEGDTLTYTWSLEAAPSGSAATLVDMGDGTASVVADVSGTYAVTLTVDDGILTDTRAVAPTIIYADEPIAVVTGYPTFFTTCLLTVNGNASTSAVGIGAYEWTVVSAPAGAVTSFADSTAAEPGFIGSLSGTYTLGLRVTDTAGNSSATTFHTATATDPLHNRQAWKQWLVPGSVTWARGRDGYIRTTYSDAGDGWLDLATEEYRWDNDTPGLPGSPPGPGAQFAGSVKWIEGAGGYYMIEGISALYMPQCIGAAPSVSQFAGGSGIFTILPLAASTSVQNADRLWEDTFNYLLTTQFFMGEIGEPGQQLSWSDALVGMVRTQNINGTFVEELVYLSTEPAGYSWSFPATSVEIPSAVIAIDGSDNDWNAVPPVWVDPLSDVDPNAPDGSDLASLKLATDATHLYLAVQLHDPPINLNQQYTIQLHESPSSAAALGNFQLTLQGSTGTLEAIVYQQNDVGLEVLTGTFPCVETPVGFELALPLDTTGTSGITLIERVVNGYFKVDTWGDSFAPAIQLIDDL